MDHIFIDISIVFIAAAILGFLAKLMKQQKIPFYVLAGLIIGPFGFNLANKYGLITWISTNFSFDISSLFIQNPEMIAVLAELGIAFLLFVVGLELNLSKLKDTGMISSFGGTIQVLTVFASGFAIALIMGFVMLDAVYMGIILAFSSTIVVVKLLVDKKEITTLHARIIIGLLLVQDFFALLVLSSLVSIENFSANILLISVLKLIGVFVLAIILSKYLFPKIFKLAAKSNEVLLLSSLAVCFFFSLVAIWMDFSPAIGAFIAGVTLANLPYNIEIVGRISSLRDFFAILFFVSLGLNFFLEPGINILIPFIVFFFFIIWFKPFITGLICNLFDYTRSTSFFTAISLAQISEFSLIILGMGYVTLGHISQSTYSLGILLAVATMSASAYFIEYKAKLYKKVGSIIMPFHLKHSGTHLGYMPEDKKSYDVILIGANRVGYSIINSLHKLKKDVLVVDYNPEIISDLMDKKKPCFYGDIGDTETMGRVNFKDSKIVISTVPTVEYNVSLIKKVKRINKKALIFVTAEQVNHALELYNLGADYVILPHFLGGEYASILLEEISQDENKLIVTKVEHIKELHKRKNIGHEHPSQTKR